MGDRSVFVYSVGFSGGDKRRLPEVGIIFTSDRFQAYRVFCVRQAYWNAELSKTGQFSPLTGAEMHQVNGYEAAIRFMADIARAVRSDINIGVYWPNPKLDFWWLMPLKILTKPIKRAFVAQLKVQRSQLLRRVR